MLIPKKMANCLHDISNRQKAVSKSLFLDSQGSYLKLVTGALQEFLDDSLQEFCENFSEEVHEENPEIQERIPWGFLCGISWEIPGGILGKNVGAILGEIFVKKIWTNSRGFQGEITRGKIRGVPQGTTGQQHDFLKLLKESLKQLQWRISRGIPVVNSRRSSVNGILSRILQYYY